MVAVFVNGTGNHQHAQFIRAGGDLHDGLAQVRRHFGQIAAFEVRLTEPRAVVASEQEIFKDAAPRQVNQIFVGVEIFSAAVEPIVEVFVGNRFLQLGKLPLFLARKFSRLLLVEQRGVLRD